MVAIKNVVFAVIASTAMVEAAGVFHALVGRDVAMRGNSDLFARATEKAPTNVHAEIIAGFQGCKTAVEQLAKDKKPEPKVVKSGKDAIITGFPPICADEARELRPKDPTFVLMVSDSMIKLHNAPESLLSKL
jgi:hypothetical protein